jgi:hypothetical protein
MKVKPDMIGHIFPNVEFKEGECNVCDSTCKFSIIENRLKTEKELFRSEIQEGAKSRWRGSKPVSVKDSATQSKEAAAEAKTALAQAKVAATEAKAAAAEAKAASQK